MNQKYEFVMFEREISDGHHISYHFVYKNFLPISPLKSKLIGLETELYNVIDLDLSRYQNAITPQNTVWNGEPVFHIGSRGEQLEDKVKEYFHIASKFPVYYFSKEIKDAVNVSPYKCGYDSHTLESIGHSRIEQALDVASIFENQASGIIFASYFDEHGNSVGDEINIEIMPEYDVSVWHNVKYKLVTIFGVKPEKIAVYDNMFQNYQATDFHWHFKVKLRHDGTTIKFYRTLNCNPYL